MQRQLVQTGCRGLQFRSKTVAPTTIEEYTAGPVGGGVADERAAGEFDRQLGLTIRARRLELGMSQERLAELLGITFQQVQKYEKGVNRIAASRLFDICAILNLSIPNLFQNLHPQGSKDSAVQEAVATAEGSQLIALFAGIKSVAVRRRIIQLVKAMKDDA